MTLASPWLRFGSFLVEQVLLVVTFGIGWLIWAATLAGDGQTPAKKMFGLRVIKLDTMRPATLGWMLFMRGILASFVAVLAIALSLGLLVLVPFFDKRFQNLWDKVSSCIVVKDPNDAWGTRAPLR